MIKHIITFLVFLVSVSFLPIYANAATLYVDINGTDTNTGSSNSPFKTIQKGIDTAVAGDTVHVNAGTYYERLSLSTDGTIGNPITIEGESGTIVDGSDAVRPGNWVAAPEIGTGVYKQTSYAYEPGMMYVVENVTPYKIPKCEDSNCLDGSKYMGYSTSQTVVTRLLDVTVNFWDGLEAMYAYSGGTLYVRFGDNSNPSSKTIRTSPSNQATFDLTNDSYITLKNLEIRGSFRGIRLLYADSNNITIDNCKIYATGREKITIDSSAHTIEIKNCEIYGSLVTETGPYPASGAWEDGTSGSAPYAQAMKEWIYVSYKHYLAEGTSSPQVEDGIRIGSAGANIDIHDSIFRDTLSGITAADQGGVVDIYNNQFHGLQQAILVSNNTNAKIYSNLFYDNNYSVRHQKCNQVGNDRYTYIYNNRMHNDDDVGDHIYYHFETTSSADPKFWIYHNSISGGYRFFYNEPTGNEAFESTRVINNVLSVDKSGRIYYGDYGFYSDPTSVEFWDYNWMGGDFSGYNGDPAWMLPNNIDAEGTTVWDTSSRPDFILPVGHAARNTGIDVSKNFEINGKTYAPLPGMESGYFTGPQPDMGIFDVNPVTADPTTLYPPLNFRIVSN